jgi:hypothetical protein
MSSSGIIRIPLDQFELLRKELCNNPDILKELTQIISKSTSLNEQPPLNFYQTSQQAVTNTQDKQSLTPPVMPPKPSIKSDKVINQPSTPPVIPQRPSKQTLDNVRKTIENKSELTVEEKKQMEQIVSNSTNIDAEDIEQELKSADLSTPEQKQGFFRRMKDKFNKKSTTTTTTESTEDKPGFFSRFTGFFGTKERHF